MGRSLSAKEKETRRDAELSRARIRAAARSRLRHVMGQLTTYDPMRMRHVCDLVTTGSGARAACLKLGMSPRTFWYWISISKEAKVMWETAREARVDSRVEATVRIADQSKDPALRIKARQWEAGKIRPKVFGDTVNQLHSGTVTLAALVAASYDRVFDEKGKERPALSHKAKP